MVCRRCVLAVEDILNREAIPFHAVSIGEIELCEALNQVQEAHLKMKLVEMGFEIISDHHNVLIERIKQSVIKRARNETSEGDNKEKLSLYISRLLHYEYTYLSSLFASVEGRTIENYFIEQRIEKAKELLVYGQQTLSEIAFDLEYSSTAHLSAQFKKITGLTPTHFKKVGLSKRKALDEV